MENMEVFVGRLPRKLTRRQLEAGLTYHFSYYDSIRSLSIRESRYKVYALVKLDHPVSAKAAVKHLNKLQLFGQGFEANKVYGSETRNGRFHRPCRNCGVPPPRSTPPLPKGPKHFWWFRLFEEEKENRDYWRPNPQSARPINQQQRQYLDFLNQRTLHHLQQHPHVLQEHVRQLPEPQLPLQNPLPRLKELDQLPLHFLHPQAQQPQPEWQAPFEQQLTQEQIIAKTLAIFPDIDPSWVAMEAANRPLGDLSNYIVENMDTVPKAPKPLKIFLCRNEACSRSWCRLCDREYDKDHTGKMCAEVETDAETANRKRLEEALTAAVVRRCHRCALPFQKTQGCNKMTCTCGATSCYLCRVPDVNYDHFCGHKRKEPNKCKLCAKRCALFEDSDKVDQDRLDEVQKNAF